MNDPFKKYRRRFRAWKNKKRLEEELRFYLSNFTSRRLILPDETTIRQILQNKFPHWRPKPKGKLTTLAIYHHYNWENISLKPALEKFGPVRHHDWFEEFNHQRKDWHSSLRAKMNQDLLPRVEKWMGQDSVDVIFTYLSGEIVTPDTMKKLKAFRIPMINLALNDKEAFVGKIRNGQAMGSRDICRYFDLCWTSTDDALKKYCLEGALPIYLPEGANPNIHRPNDLPKTVDVSFVGQCYGERPEVIRRLAPKGIQVETYGEGWPKGPLSTEEMVQLYSRSKINLGFGGIAGHKDMFCLKGRDFEIPMSGGLYLTEYHPELERAYDVQNEIMTYIGFDDLLAKIRYLLSNPEKAEEIRKRGYQRARYGHTWEHRFEKIFRLMGLIS
ncbi:MAG: glycosyltransferase [Pseudomonadota bacterium]